MTLVAPPPIPPALETVPAADPPSAKPATPAPTWNVARAVLISLALLLALVIGFAVFLIAFSGLSERHAQDGMRKTFLYDLSQAVAPIKATTPGRPVAVLDIPAINIHTLVVVEGTSSRNLMAGPGHLITSPMPGQAGVSTIFGKSTTFGAPFERLLDLRPGDRIYATTGQGRQTYVVSSFGDTKHPAPVNSDNTLRLVTASDAFDTDDSVVVSADLTSPLQDTPPAAPVVLPSSHSPMASDPGASLVPLAGWSQLLLLTAIAGTWLLHRGPRWPVILCLGAVLTAVLWNVYENAAGLLPNMV